MSDVTEPLHGGQASLNSLDILSGKANLLRSFGANESAKELEPQIKQAREAARQAAHRDQEITSYGTNFLKSVGLFFPGGAGRVSSAALFGLDSARPSDPIGLRIVDFGLGAGKGFAMKLAMDKIGDSKMNVAGKAFLTGCTFRLTETALTRQNWQNKETGAPDLLGGLGRSGWSLIDPAAVVNDALVFGSAHYVLGRAKLANPNLMKNALVANGLGGVCFGFSSGTFNELRRSRETQTPFEFRRAFIQGGLDGVASLPGGYRMRQLQLREPLAALEPPAGAAAPKSLPENTAGQLKENLPSASSEAVLNPAASASQPKGLEILSLVKVNDLVTPCFPDYVSVRSLQRTMGTGRQFMVVGGHEHLNQFAQGGSGSALLKVREVAQSGAVSGDSKSLLVQHLEPGRPLVEAARQADLIASCNPQMLESAGLRARHVLPDAGGVVWMTGKGANLRFLSEPTLDLTKLTVAMEPWRAEFLSPRAGAGACPQRAIPLSKPVAELLKEVPRDRRYWDLHNLNDFADAMRGFRVPGKRIAGGGVDSMVIELVDGRMLKITDKWFDPEWGSRTYPDPRTGEPRVFDAKLLSEPRQVVVNDRLVTWYLQEKVKMTISVPHLDLLASRIDAGGKYLFWDMNFTSHGKSQAGYAALPNGRRRLAIADFDSVRYVEDVPQTHGKPREYAISPWD